MSFWPGQRVECVLDSFEWFPKPAWWKRLLRRDGPGPQRGRVYVVDGVGLGFGQVMLQLSGFPDVQYSAHAFRPIVETELEKLREIAAQPELTELDRC